MVALIYIQKVILFYIQNGFIRTGRFFRLSSANGFVKRGF